jgi:hypothetical protein
MGTRTSRGLLSQTEQQDLTPEIRERRDLGSPSQKKINAKFDNCDPCLEEGHLSGIDSALVNHPGCCWGLR